ncbi:hypothetical protein KW796_00840 [Candidatus Parcubacteria bacterium]|nr:hypothetical protein [Candidatus Parcubacteria bacterium]
MLTFSTLLGVVAGVVQVFGYWTYNRKVQEGLIKEPNGTSWGLWGIGSLLAVFFLRDLTHDWVKEVLPALCSASAFILFAAYAKKKMLKRPDRLDYFTIALDTAVVLYWFVSGEAGWSNLLLAIDTGVTFIPMVRDVWSDPSSEQPKPWKTWTIAYGIWTAAILLRLETPWELFYPVSCFTLHGVVWYLSSKTTAKS